jgi:hypothetical protein
MASSPTTKPTYPELLDIPSATLKEAGEQIDVTIEYAQRRACIVLVGESGLGKTQIFDQIARKHKYNLCPIHAAQFNLIGAGIPGRAENGFFDLAVPSSFPKPGEKSIVFFDEINRAVKHAINMFFTMLEDRRLFNYRLPEGCIVAAAMNPSDAQYAVTKIENEPAIRRRVKFLWITHSSSDWLAYAETANFHYGDCVVARDKPCHPDILAYFRANPKAIYDVKAKEAGRQYVCPATIQTISEDAYVLAAAEIPLAGERARTRFSASIGLTQTQQLVAYIEDHSVMISAADVLYRPRATRTAIQSLKDDAQHEKLADLAENVLTVLFADLPEDMNQTARNFLSFCRILPLEQAAAFCQQMNAHAEGDVKFNYLKNLMAALQHLPNWFNLQIQFDSTHRAIDEAITTGTGV